MRIEWSPAQAAKSVQREARAAGSDRAFAEDLAETSSKASAPASTLTSVDNLFVLQEVAEEVTGRRRALKRGTALLDRLDELRHALLAGALPRSQLEALRQIVQQHEPVIDDPQLAAILSEIELRVAVELAKLDSIV